MSVSFDGVSRHYGVGGAPSYLPSAGCRPTIERYHIDYAAQRRAIGWGWQAIATQLRVNELDLRVACGDPAAVEAKVAQPARTTAAASAAPATAVPPDAPTSLRMLAAIADGAAANRRALGDLFQLPLHVVTKVVAELKTDGLLTGDARAGTWCVTGRGYARITRSGRA
jgi:hypothetical protein